MAVRRSSDNLRKAGENFGFFDPTDVAQSESVLADYFPELSLKFPAKGARGGRLGKQQEIAEKTITVKPKEAYGAAPDYTKDIQGLSSQLSAQTQELASLRNQLATREPAAPAPTPAQPVAQPPAQEKPKTGEELLREQTSTMVRGLYKEYLGREPDEPGFKYWTETDPRAVGGYDPTEVTTLRKSFEESPEYRQKQRESTVSSAYQQTFGRAPDTEGLKYWSANQSAGNTVEDVKQQLLASAKSTAGEDRVRVAYREALGRDPDEAGLKYWSQQGAAETDFEKFKNQLRTAAGVR